MSDLNFVEKRQLENALDMSSGYVLYFSNRTFAEFFVDSVNIDIYDEKYNYMSGSKANRMRAFWDHESNFTVGKLLGDIFDNWDELTADYPESPVLPKDCLRIVQRLKESAPVTDIEAIRTTKDDRNFESLAKSVRESIDRNEPENGLDRLHTFVIKHFRTLCEKREIATGRDTPLHSLVGLYIKVLKQEHLIESIMTERILKSSISVMEAFNKVRNEQSYAHDNPVLNYSESILIFNHITSLIRFTKAIESRSSSVGVEKDEDDDGLPF